MNLGMAGRKVLEWEAEGEEVSRQAGSKLLLRKQWVRSQRGELCMPQIQMGDS